MLIVDSQVHIWGADTPERPWPRRIEPQREIPLGHEELLREMNAAGVDRAVLVPPSWEGDRNDLALEAVRQHPDRFAIMGRIDLDAPDARHLIAWWLRQPGMHGLRFTFSTPAGEKPLVDGSVDWLWAAAEEAGVPIMLLTGHTRMPLIDRVAERHPGLKLILDHMGLVGSTKGPEAFRDLDLMLALAKRPNVAVKVSALPFFSLDEYPYRSAHAPLRRVYDTFGPKRMFWGTDFSRFPCTYRQGVTMFTEEIPWVTTDDKTWIMGRGICEWIRWPV